MSDVKTDTATADKFYNKLGVNTYGVAQARKAIDIAKFTMRSVVCLVGEAGIGKTHIVRQAAEDRKPPDPFEWHGRVWKDTSPLVLLPLAQMQSEDTGMPKLPEFERDRLVREAAFWQNCSDRDPKDTAAAERYAAIKLRLAKQDTFDVSNGFDFVLPKSIADLPPHGILFLDEWNRADKAVVKAFFTLVEDRHIHNKRIPDGIQIVAAMNPSEGAYVVNEAEKDHAIRRRLTFVAVHTSLSSFLSHASERGKFHPHVMDFVRSMPAYLHDTRRRDVGKVYPCPAKWESVSEVLKAAEENKIPLSDDTVTMLIEGHIGDEAGRKFSAFIHDSDLVINPSDILTKYTDKSQVRKRVLKLAEENRNDIIDELCTGLAATLFSDKPDTDTIAPALALFMGDLPEEMAIAFIAHKMGGESSGSDTSEKYFGQLSKSLHTQKPYAKLVGKIMDAMKKGRASSHDQTVTDAGSGIIKATR